MGITSRGVCGFGLPPQPALNSRIVMAPRLEEKDFLASVGPSLKGLRASRTRH